MYVCKHVKYCIYQATIILMHSSVFPYQPSCMVQMQMYNVQHKYSFVYIISRYKLFVSRYVVAMSVSCSTNVFHKTNNFTFLGLGVG